MTKLILPLLISVIPLLGSLFKLHQLYILNIMLICLIVILVVKNKVDESLWGLYIFSISLSLIWSTSVYSRGLVGSDIHMEYLMFRQALTGWDMSIANAYNSSILLGVILPFLSNTFGLSGYFLFKVICPLPLALVPVIQYKMASRLFDKRIAFLSCIFFISFISFFLEIPSIVKMELGFLFFALEVYLLLSKSSKLNYALITLMGILASMVHYTMGVLSLIYLLGTLGFLILIRIIKYFKTFSSLGNFSLSLKGLVISALFITLVGGLYLGTVAGGSALNCLVGLGEYFTKDTTVTWVDPNYGYIPGFNGTITIERTSPLKDIFKVPLLEKIGTLDPLLRSALGLDFFDVSIWGKLFRILQWITEVLLIVGLAQFKKVPLVYLGLALTAFLTLGLNFLIPSFSSLLNPTRWYQVALFVLTPLAVSEIFILLKTKAQLILCSILIPYLLFTSGFVFEITKSNLTYIIDVPFSVPLSNYRLDIGSCSSSNDIALAEFAYSNNFRPILGDFYGAVLLGENRRIGEINLLPEPLSLPKEVYILLRERNEVDKELTFWNGIGLIKSVSYKEMGMDTLLERCELVKQIGDAKIYLYKGE